MITATFTFPKGEFDDAFDALNAEMAQLAAQTTKIARKSFDIGQRRAGHDRVAQRLEEAVAVVVVQERAGSCPVAQARARVSGVSRAPAISSCHPRRRCRRPAHGCRRRPSSATARASRNSTLRPPRPLPAARDRGLAAARAARRAPGTAGRAAPPAARCRPAPCPRRAPRPPGVAQDVAA